MELVSADRVGQRRVDQREVESVDQVLSWLDGVGQSWPSELVKGELVKGEVHESVDQVLSWLDGVGLCAEQVSWSGGELISSWSKILSLKITTQM